MSLARFRLRARELIASRLRRGSTVGGAISFHEPYDDNDNTTKDESDALCILATKDRVTSWRDGKGAPLAPQLPPSIVRQPSTASDGEHGQDVSLRAAMTGATGSSGECITFYDPRSGKPGILVGLGKEEDLRKGQSSDLRHIFRHDGAMARHGTVTSAVSTAVKELRKRKDIQSVDIHIAVEEEGDGEKMEGGEKMEDGEKMEGGEIKSSSSSSSALSSSSSPLVGEIVRAALHSNYSFDLYKTTSSAKEREKKGGAAEEVMPPLQRFMFSCSSDDEGTRLARIGAEATNLARDLGVTSVLFYFFLLIYFFPYLFFWSCDSFPSKILSPLLLSSSSRHVAAPSSSVSSSTQWYA